MKDWMLKKLPAALRQRIRESAILKKRHAARLASTSKRIDICAAQFAHMLHLSRLPSLEGKVCLEVGAGWVLTHAVVCHLLGARRIIATDVAPNACPESLSRALRGAVHSLPRDILAPFSDHSLIRERHDRLLSIRRFSLDTLADIGIEYRSPVDLAVSPPDASVDFIYSHSVLEHVPAADLPPLLRNLASSLAHGGAMIHGIHLEDHADAQERPFGFLEVPGARYTRELQSDRGNRVRCSEWRRLFAGLEGCTTEFIYQYSRRDKPLPGFVDPSVCHSGEDDLRTSHVGAYTRKVRRPG